MFGARGTCDDFTRDLLSGAAGIIDVVNSSAARFIGADQSISLDAIRVLYCPRGDNNSGCFRARWHDIPTNLAFEQCEEPIVLSAEWLMADRGWRKLREIKARGIHAADHG